MPDLDRPVGVPAAYADHAKMMFDLQTLALQGDITRVITFQLARETSTRTYPEIGVPEPHHPLRTMPIIRKSSRSWRRSMRFTYRCLRIIWKAEIDSRWRWVAAGSYDLFVRKRDGKS